MKEIWELTEYCYRNFGGLWRKLYIITCIIINACETISSNNVQEIMKQFDHDHT